ncbi:hypothetical protein MVEG_12376 [Podila verticillata NRRL 6337]|uniref:Uncharacterized protein n=1 Tax=Podila verticillata NRRL 6337 TaxID=1069443 RepID=A0A086TIL6_9FUNG|nr:hypothetical protein MVEG_12376 [Podila verticillata NRRL 6337]
MVSSLSNIFGIASYITSTFMSTPTSSVTSPTVDVATLVPFLSLSHSLHTTLPLKNNDLDFVSLQLIQSLGMMLDLTSHCCYRERNQHRSHSARFWMCCVDTIHPT